MAYSAALADYGHGMVGGLWREFVEATGIDGPSAAWSFGDASTLPALSTALALLVRDRPKRATAGLLADYEREGEALPQALRPLALSAIGLHDPFGGSVREHVQQ